MQQYFYHFPEPGDVLLVMLRTRVLEALRASRLSRGFSLEEPDNRWSEVKMREGSKCDLCLFLHVQIQFLRSEP